MPRRKSPAPRRLREAEKRARESDDAPATRLTIAPGIAVARDSVLARLARRSTAAELAAKLGLEAEAATSQAPAAKRARGPTQHVRARPKAAATVRSGDLHGPAPPTLELSCIAGAACTLALPSELAATRKRHKRARNNRDPRADADADADAVAALTALMDSGSVSERHGLEAFGGPRQLRVPMSATAVTEGLLLAPPDGHKAAALRFVCSWPQLADALAVAEGARWIPGATLRALVLARALAIDRAELLLQPAPVVVPVGWTTRRPSRKDPSAQKNRGAPIPRRLVVAQDSALSVGRNKSRCTTDWATSRLRASACLGVLSPSSVSTNSPRH